MPSISPHIGVLFFRDLTSFAPWIHHRAPRWAAARGLTGALRPPTHRPPPGLVLIIEPLYLNQLIEHPGWLRGAQRVVLVLDGPEDEALALLPEERDELHARLPNLVGVIEAVEGALEGCIDEALRRLEGVEGAWPAWGAAPTRRALPPGPWIPWALERGRAFDRELEGRARLLCASVCWRGDRPTLLDCVDGARLDLISGARAPDLGLCRLGYSHRPLLAGPHGVHSTIEHGRDLRVGGIGVDPSGRLAWAGHRCWFRWFVMTEEGPAHWTPSAHGWPDGHGKKLYGYEDNEPRRVDLAADASAALSVYAHDALLTPGLPLRWRDVGGFALGERVYGPPRALLFQRGDEPDRFPGDPRCAEEDARDAHPTITLGPSDDIRYVVGLEAPVWRLRGGEEVAERLGGPEARWIAYDAQHAPVLEGEGRLLAGWDRWIIVQEGEALRRGDLLTGAWAPLGEVGRGVDYAIPLQGSPNALLLSMEGEGAWLRVV